MNYKMNYGCFISAFAGSLLSQQHLLGLIIMLMLSITIFFLGVFAEKYSNIIDEYLDLDKYITIYKKLSVNIKSSFNKQETHSDSDSESLEKKEEDNGTKKDN